MRSSDRSSDVCSSDLSDGFHTLTLHRSLMEIGQFGSNADDIYSNAPEMYGIDVASDEGHTLRCIPAEQTFSLAMGSGVDSMTPEERLKILPPPGITPQLLPQLQKHLSPEQMRLMALSPPQVRSEEHTSELQSLMRISYAVFCLKKNKTVENKL